MRGDELGTKDQRVLHNWLPFQQNLLFRPRELKKYRGRDSHGLHFEPATFGDISILSGSHILADYESRPRMGVAGAMGQAMLPRRLPRTDVTM